jgi:ATP-dependent DNA helicase DinG
MTETATRAKPAKKSAVKGSKPKGDSFGTPTPVPVALPSDPNEILNAVLKHRGWDRRDGQVTMVSTIAEALVSSDFGTVDVAVNAPVGTGKTLAYIIACLARRGRIVIATSTKSLQEQIIAEELPKLREDLRAIYGYELTYGVLKGQSNYACLNKIRDSLGKVDGSKADDLLDLEMPDSRDISVLREILRRGDEAVNEGDVLRYDSEYLLARMTPDGQAKYSASKGCTHKSKKWWTAPEETDDISVAFSLGPQYQGFEPHDLVRALAHDATCAYRAAYAHCVMSDVVVLNSSLLVSEIQREATREHADLLAGSAVVVVDEAHHLPRILAESYSSTTDFEKMSKDFKSVIPKVATRYGDEARGMIEAVYKDLIELENEIIEIDDSDMGVKAHRLAIGKAAATWKEKAVPTLAGLKVKGATAKPSEAVNNEGVPKPLAELLRPIDGDEDSAMAQVGILKGVMQANDDGEFVNEVTIQGRSSPKDTALVVKQVPVDVTRFRYDISRRSTTESLLVEGIGAPAAVVLSSGTITFGTPGLVGMRTKSFIDVPSPFDSRKARLYIPATIPEPSAPNWVAESWKEMRSAIEAVNGRAMILTTSKAKTLEFADLCKRDLKGKTIITQYDGAKREVVAKFAADEHSVIIGTISMWEGVDVPGQSLSLVIMDKMPFPMPNDAVFAARRKWIEKHKGNAFMEVDVDHAAVMLAQGAGRLIRSVGDIGAVMIMDKRIISKRYGAAAIGLLPHDWMMTSDRAAFDDWLHWVAPETRSGDIPKPNMKAWRPIRVPRQPRRKLTRD